MTNYSRDVHNSRKFATNHAAPLAAAAAAAAAAPRPGSAASLAKVERFIDSASEQEQEPGWHAHPGQTQQVAAKSSRRQASREDSQPESSDESVERYLNRRQEQFESNLEEPVEEIYLCHCCGFSKQLKPAMTHLSSFKLLFYLFNFLTLALAFSLFGLGLWYRIDPKVYELHKYIATQNFTLAGWLMLAAGALTCLVCLLGHRAARRAAACPLVFYCLFMTISSVAFVCTTVLLTVHGLGDSLENFMTKEIYDQIRRRAFPSQTLANIDQDPSPFLDFVQVKLQCCGAQDFRDYQAMGATMPASCYTIPSNYVMAPGCGEAIRRLLDVRAGVAAALASACVFCQILGTLSAALIACSIYNQRAETKQVQALANRSRSASPAYRTVTKQNSISHLNQFDDVPRQFQPTQQRSPRPLSRSSMTSIRV